jgi:hypothetical protein
MSFELRNVNRLSSQLSISLQQDEDGYLGRECPEEKCQGYFKITPGTGIQGPAPYRCPYCGHSGDPGQFNTKEQIEYAKSIVLRQFTDALFRDLKSMEFDHRPRSGFGIGLSLKVTRDAPHPVQYYREKDLETEVVCENCKLRFAIYGVFGWCPDCGQHNSLQILSKNLELVRKELHLAQTAEKDLAEHLVADALKNVVSAFDAFGREVCSQKGAEIRFQNLAGARRNVWISFNFNFDDVLSQDEWASICLAFQKRHLLVHKMGVADEDYIQKANAPDAITGRKIRITEQDVESSVFLIERLARRLYSGIL